MVNENAPRNGKNTYQYSRYRNTIQFGDIFTIILKYLTGKCVKDMS